MNITHLSSKDIALDNIIPAVLPWIYLAGNPYYDWFFGDSVIANHILRLWMARSSSEIYVKRIRAIYYHNKIIGGYIALSGKELQQCRKADLITLIKNIDSEDINQCREKMIASKGLFSKVDVDHYYLSKIGVDSLYRQKGYGGKLMEEYVRDGLSLGHRRFCLDVCVANKTAIHCYQKFGFKIISTSGIINTPVQYYSMEYEEAYVSKDTND